MTCLSILSARKPNVEAAGAASEYNQAFQRAETADTRREHTVIDRYIIFQVVFRLFKLDVFSIFFDAL